MNCFLATGRLTKDIVLRQTQNGNKVMQNTIAVNRPFKDEKGEYQADFITIVAYNQTAEYLSNHASKGALIEVNGRWQHRSYQDNQGNTKYVDECIVNSASVLQKPQEQAVQPETKPQAQAQPQVQVKSNYDYPDDLPF